MKLGLYQQWRVSRPILWRLVKLDVDPTGEVHPNIKGFEPSVLPSAFPSCVPFDNRFEVGFSH